MSQYINQQDKVALSYLKSYDDPTKLPEVKSSITPLKLGMMSTPHYDMTRSRA